jgi:hypothetical protein
MNEESTRKCVRQVEHMVICDADIPLRVNKVMVATLNLSKSWLQLNQEESLIQ